MMQNPVFRLRLRNGSDYLDATSMLHPLEQKIVALRRRVRRMAAVYGLSVVAAALLGTMAALGLIDYLLRFQDRGLRIIASLLSWACSAGPFIVTSSWRCWCALGDADLALRVERRFPDLDDRLLSAVEFLQPPKTIRRPARPRFAGRSLPQPRPRPNGSISRPCSTGVRRSAPAW